MTPAQAATLRWFEWGEFRHPELLDFAFVQWLDHVRAEYAFPIVVTSDARSAPENMALEKSGAAPNSRHMAGQAVDIVFPPTKNHLWLLVAAVLKCTQAAPIELELVHGPSDSHVHIAWLQAGRASSLELALT